MSEPLVFLPGMMCDASLFLPQIAAFSKKVPIFVMPLHGHDKIASLARHILDKAPRTFSIVLNSVFMAFMKAELDAP